MKILKMNIRGLSVMMAAALAFATAVLPSCKKKDKDDSKEFLTGRMSYQLPVYVHPGDVFEVRPSGVKHPKGGNLGYYVYTSWDSKRDTLRYPSSTDTSPVVYTLKIPENIIGEGYNFVFYAIADGYYDASRQTEFTIVTDDMEDAFSGLDYTDSDPRFTDSRDGMTYRTVTIGDREWLRQNLSYAGSGVPFSNCPAMTRNTGNFYSWEEAVSACPEGWHLSTEEDWLALGRHLKGDESLAAHEMFPGIAGDLMVDAKFFSSRMWGYWPNDVTITNKSGFNALSFGFADKSGAGAPRFISPNEYAVFWTADEDSSDSSKAWLRYIHYRQADVLTGTADKGTFLASVRCVRD